MNKDTTQGHWTELKGKIKAKAETEYKDFKASLDTPDIRNP